MVGIYFRTKEKNESFFAEINEPVQTYAHRAPGEGSLYMSIIYIYMCVRPSIADIIDLSPRATHCVGEKDKKKKKKKEKNKLISADELDLLQDG